jgi:hypothetical protein
MKVKKIECIYERDLEGSLNKWFKDNPHIVIHTIIHSRAHIAVYIYYEETIKFE